MNFQNSRGQRAENDQAAQQPEGAGVAYQKSAARNNRHQPKEHGLGGRGRIAQEFIAGE